MGFGNTKSESNASDSRVALDGGGSVLQAGSGIFNSGRGKTNWTQLLIVGGCIALLALWLWKKK